MSIVIAVPYFPGSNGDIDTISKIEKAGMIAKPIYFHYNNLERLKDNSNELLKCAGAVIPGGFPYEDRLGFGKIPSVIQEFSKAIRRMVDDGKPVLAFCSGNQIAHMVGLAFPKESAYKVKMLENICDKNGKIIHNNFLNKIVYTKLQCKPNRTAFTFLFKKNEVIPEIIAHGGGRFFADNETLKYIHENGLIITKYCNKNGEIIDNFPTNPNGSILNIESITNVRGNLKIGMCHNERSLNSLTKSRSNLVFDSMREYIKAKCPDLSFNIIKQEFDIIKNYSYLKFDCEEYLDVYIEMLTDDNELATAKLFLGKEFNINRRKLIRIGLKKNVDLNQAKKIIQELAKLDVLDGIMLKKDVPSFKLNNFVYKFEVVSRENGKIKRKFSRYNEIIEGFLEKHIEIPELNVQGQNLFLQVQRNDLLKNLVKQIAIGKVWFFKNSYDKEYAIKRLLH